ncbi:MAG: 3-deoxy-manno-octulosonate cytidylyltransferase [Alphaproteobacteria bacterium MarineAlpha9_Bin4]|nr:3-deoxy-manno-octulosonate cytidylyltransferase [Pelagibacterales bacterium]PPR26716.1 MAG: 3-deoxy-manno-octulosonate cytidylyltransferase [Alphaproteobacteria bacterium MarineAlpha9_Bin4]|tara:strand:- start:382 stop:1125 length:744 start_codon:yes stop_codon:yes gene_type:complete
MTKTLIIIPVRMASTRFPGKPLISIHRKTMIERVWEIAVKAKIGDVYVACCDKEVERFLIKKKIKYIFTKKNLKSGTDRVYNAYNKIKTRNDYKLIINLQGDMPFFNYLYLRKFQKLFKQKKIQMATMASPILNKRKILDRNVVKIAMTTYKNNIHRALYFSRSPIPFGANKYFEHVGVYAYTPQTLKDFVKMKVSKLEEFEKLEQLRALENKVEIFVTLINKAPISIDTRGDLKELLKSIKIKGIL